MYVQFHAADRLQASSNLQLYGSMQGAARLDVYKEKRLTAEGFIRSCAEPSVYYMPPSSPYGLVVVTTVVDDFKIVCQDKHMPEIKRKLRSIWTLTDGGPIR